MSAAAEVPHEEACATRSHAWEVPDRRRWLQLVLALIWLLDGVLQFQSFMFTKAFAQTLAQTAGGNPRVIADPITWAARIIADHPTPTNAAFATIQVLLGLGIAWRPTVKAALVASIGWSVAVWWFGEGLGGVLNGSASPVSGAPGAVILYALLAVLLWPTTRDRVRPEPFVAARPVGAGPARLLWLVLWGSLAYFAVEPAANRAPQAVRDMIAGMADGEPGWLAHTENGAAGVVAHQGLLVSVVLAVVLGLVAVGVFLPARRVRPVLVTAVVCAAAIWLFGEALGAVFTGQGTDVNSGPLLALLACAYWPCARTGPSRADAVEDVARDEQGARR